MYKLSTNAASIVVLAFSLFGFEVSEAQVADVISAVGILVAFYGLIRNQVARRDSKGFFLTTKK